MASQAVFDSKEVLVRAQNIWKMLMQQTHQEPSIPISSLAWDPILPEQQTQSRQLLASLYSSSFRTIVGQQEAIEKAVNLLAVDFSGSSSSNFLS